MSTMRICVSDRSTSSRPAGSSSTRTRRLSASGKALVKWRVCASNCMRMNALSSDSDHPNMLSSGRLKAS